MTDPIADFLTRIRNAILARHAEVVAPASKLKQRIAEFLKDEGYIAGYDVRDGRRRPSPEIVVKLRWADPRTNAITGLRRARAPASACTSATARSPRSAPASASPSCRRRTA